MSFKNFVPEVWSQTILKELKPKTIFAAGSHNEYIGKITEAGDSITFKGLADPTVFEINFEDRNKDIPEAEDLEDLSLKMPIRQIRLVHFGVGDIDKAQANGVIMSLAKESVPQQIADKIDKYIASLAVSADAPKFYKTPMLVARGESSATQINPMDLVDLLVEALQENNVPASAPLEMIVSPKFYRLLKQEYRELDTNNSGVLSTGDVGKYNNVTIKMSNNIHKTGTNNANHHLLIRTKQFIGYADALSEMEAYRPERKFKDCIKGLYLFDAKVIRPKQGFFVPVKFS